MAEEVVVKLVGKKVLRKEAIGIVDGASKN
jgi:hypothetical protein